MDLLTKDYPWYTPYQFAGNKPIKFFDLDGVEEADPQQLQAEKNGQTHIQKYDQEAVYESGDAIRIYIKVAFSFGLEVGLDADAAIPLITAKAWKGVNRTFEGFLQIDKDGTKTLGGDADALNSMGYGCGVLGYEYEKNGNME